MLHQPSKKSVNQFGLSRDIPSSIKREVRRRCGFGCVICGSFIYQYHHHNPPFSEARYHDPEGIALLCGGCHERASKGLLSDSRIKKAVDKPKCLEQGFSHFPLDVGENFPVIRLGSSVFVGNPTIISVSGKRLLAVDRPEEIGGPFRISAEFYDQHGNQTCRLVENEWQGFSSNWDITSKGKTITVHSDNGEIALGLRIIPPNEINIDRLNMVYKGYRICVEKNGQTTIYLPNGCMHAKLDRVTYINNTAAIFLDDHMSFL